VVGELFNFSEILNKCATILDSKAANRKIKIEVKINQKCPEEVKNDHKRLQQVLINLLSNAIKFSPRVSVIKIFASPIKVKDIDFIKISVKDTGVGIKEQDIPRLFKEFGRVKSDENDRLNPQGVGLGLWISSNLASRMGTQLRVKSNYGKGSTFTFEILTDLGRLNEENFGAKLAEAFALLQWKPSLCYNPKKNFWMTKRT